VKKLEQFEMERISEAVRKQPSYWNCVSRCPMRELKAWIAAFEECGFAIVEICKP
jgi:hypothetical protein